MALLQFSCPYCTGIFHVEDSFAGSHLACPMCGGQVSVAAAPAAADFMDGPPPPPPGFGELPAAANPALFGATPPPHPPGLATPPLADDDRFPPGMGSAAPLVGATDQPPPAPPASPWVTAVPTTAVLTTAVADLPATAGEADSMFPPGFCPPGSAATPPPVAPPDPAFPPAMTLAPPPIVVDVPAIDDLLPPGVAPPSHDILPPTLAALSDDVDSLLPPGALPEVESAAALLPPGALPPENAPHDDVSSSFQPPVSAAAPSSPPEPKELEDIDVVPKATVKVIGSGASAVVLRHVGPEERAARRLRRNFIMATLCFMVLLITALMVLEKKPHPDQDQPNAPAEEKK